MARKIFLSATLVILMILPLKATHLMGGEITVKELGNNRYEILLTAYRDTGGIPMQAVASFAVSQRNGSFSQWLTTPQDTSLSGSLIQGIPYGVEIYLFRDTVQVPGPGSYQVSWQNCCRNGAILNMSQPLNEAMYLQSIFLVDSSANSTPVFLAPPITYLPVGVPWQYNALPVDADGDSLAWSLVTPLDDANQPVQGYQLPPADTSNPFSIDPVSGTITWTADTVGNFVASLLVEEYRNGQKIGEIRRDMQMVVINSGNQMPSMANWGQFNTDAQGRAYVHILSGAPHQFPLQATDADMYDQVHLQAFGEPFHLDTQAAQFVIDTPGNKQGMVQGTFSWNPAQHHRRPEPYRVVFRLSDGQFVYDETLLIYVNGTVGLAPAAPIAKQLSLYPQPARDFFTLRTQLPHAGKVQMHLVNARGQIVAQWHPGPQRAGAFHYRAPLDAPPGLYFVQLLVDGQPSATRRLLVR